MSNISHFKQKNKGGAGIKPQSIESEKTLLCSLFLDNSKFIDVSEIVDSKDFYDERNGILFSVLKELYLNNTPIDFITVKNALDEKGLSEKIGIIYLTSLTDYLPVPANAKYYAEIIHKKAVLRELISMSHEVAEICYDEPENIEEVLNITESKLVNIALEVGKKKILGTDEINNANIEVFENIIHGVKVQNKAMWGIVGATSTGKTDFALDVAKGYAETTKEPVIYCQYEGTKQELILRTQKKGTWKENVTFLLKPTFSLILGYVKQNQKFNKKTLIIIDYLQRFARFLQAQEEKNKKRAYEGLRIYVNQIYEFFDNLRQEYDISVLFIMSMSKSEIAKLSQINKIMPVEILNAIKESGDVQYDLDYVYSMTFSDKPNFQESYIGRFTADGQKRRYMQLRVAKGSRIGTETQNHVYEFIKKDYWNGYALVPITETKTQEKQKNNNKEKEVNYAKYGFGKK